MFFAASDTPSTLSDKVHPSSAEILRRARGCLFGQLAGDALGSLVEFQSADTIRTKYPNGVRQLADGGIWKTLAGQPTDDSELALSLARTLVRHGTFDEAAVIAAYIGWYRSGPFDIGITTATALEAAEQNRINPATAAKQAANRGSQANGALMRISPLGIFGHALPPARLAAWARMDAALTHPNPVCLDASALFTITISYALTTGKNAREIYVFARQWADETDLHPDVRQSLVAAAAIRPADYMTQMGWVRIALQNAFYELLHAATLEEGIVNTVGQGGDADTNGAIAGALLGAVHGIEAVPAQWRNCILDCRPEAGAPGVRRPRPRDFWPVDALELAEQLVMRGFAAAREENP